MIASMGRTKSSTYPTFSGASRPVAYLSRNWVPGEARGEHRQQRLKVHLAGEPMPPEEIAMIIDSHCHAGKGDRLTGPWDTAAPLNNYLSWAAACGITRTVLFAAFHSDYAIANREVARIVATDRARFIGFAFVHPDRDRGRVHKLVGIAVEQYGFRGIKVHRHDGRITREICEAAKAYRLPVLYDVMGEVSVV